MEELKYICNSGGAIGSDLWFENFSHEKGIKVRAYSFEGHNTKSRFKVILSPDQLNESDVFLAAASERLHRPIPKANKYVLNLLRRNWYQIKDADTIYAVGTIVDTKGSVYQSGDVNGGTGWAIAMAQTRNMNPMFEKIKIYVFDLNYNIWLRWNGERWIHDADNPLPSKPKKVFAGIGTREINNNGINAIKNLINSL